MFISNSKRFIFIHLHKTGGTSIEHALNTSLQWNDILLGSTKTGEALQKLYKPVFGLYKHSNARQVRKVVGEAVWRNYFTFSIVRNPYALVVSQYTFARDWVNMGMKRDKLGKAGLPTLNHQNKLPECWPWQYPAVRAFIETSLDKDNFTDFIRSPRLDSWIGMQPLWEQLCNRKTGKQVVDYVTKLETINQDWPFILQRIGLKPVPLERKNSSPSDLPVSAYYARDDDAEFVRQRFKNDFRIFGYSPDPEKASSQ